MSSYKQHQTLQSISSITNTVSWNEKVCFVPLGLYKYLWCSYLNIRHLSHHSSAVIWYKKQCDLDFQLKQQRKKTSETKHCVTKLSNDTELKTLSQKKKYIYTSLYLNECSHHCTVIINRYKKANLHEYDYKIKQELFCR